MILNPGEYFAVVRQLADPNDSGTYYVQAKVRNARTDALITTLNLTDRGGQRFSKEYQVPPDPSGVGFYISVATRVYTDAAFTTLSDAYGQEINTYLVDNRFRNLGGGGGGSDVDYKKISKIFQQVLADFQFPSFDSSPILLSIKNLGMDTLKSLVTSITSRTERIENTVAAIDAKEPEKTDLTPVLAAIAALPDQIETTPETDLTPLLDAVEGFKSSMEERLKEVSARLDSSEFKAEFANLPAIAGDVAKIQKDVKDFLYIVETKAGAPAPVEKPDYTAQARGMVGITKKK